MKNLWKRTAFLVVMLFLAGEEQTFAQKKNKSASNKSASNKSALSKSASKQAPRTVPPRQSTNASVQTPLQTKQISALQPLFTTTMFFDSNLTKQWKKLDSCLNKGLPKSALEIADKILLEARKTKNMPHVVKALLVKSSLTAETREDGETSFVREMQSAIQDIQKNAPAQGMSAENVVSLALLRSALAEYYWLYFNNNRWNIQQRTAQQPNTADEKTTSENAPTPDDDYRAWDMRRFVTTIRELHFAALGNAQVLQQTPVNTLEILLLPNENAAIPLRPTLYDLLAHRAIEMLNNTATTLPTPEKEFEIRTSAGFAPVQDVIKNTILWDDNDDWKYRAMLLYRDILTFHSTDATPDALADVNLFRLKFAKEHSFGEDVQDQYLRALERDALTYKSSPIAAEYWCAIAQEYLQSGDYIKARSIVQKALEYSESVGSQNARVVERQIIAKELSIQTEKTVLPNAPFLVSVKFRNCETVHFRLYRLPKREENADDELSNRMYDDAELKRFLERKAALSWTEKFPLNDSNGVNDYKAHTTFVKVPVALDSLPLGRYILVASAEPTFPLKGNHLAWTRFTASRLALTHNGLLLVVTDAATGEPQSGVTVRLLHTNYNYTKRRNEEVLVNTLTTDKNGMCSSENLALEHGVFVELQRGNDILRDGTTLYRSYEQEILEKEVVKIFTDRALYRPGQTVYFKGIAMHANSAKPDYSVLRGRSFTVKLHDANMREIATQSFTSNEYGSFHGTFTIPLGVLNGQMQLRVNESYESQALIMVEEYKRPKFEAKLDKPKGNERLGEMVKVRGNARNYAGSVVDGAQVQFRVVRNAVFPYWRDWWWQPQAQSPQKEIARGRVVTDAKGDFEIEFLAAPDKSIAPKTLPQFNYTVYADVTDISGETHTASETLALGYVSTVLRVNVAERLEKSSLTAKNAANTLITLQTQNLNGEALSTQGTVRLERLSTPTRIFRKRILPKPDRFAMSENAFAQAFPLDIFNNENERETWKVEKEILSAKFLTGVQGSYNLVSEASVAEKIAQLSVGVYRITANVRDISGQMLEQVRHFTVFDTSAKTPAIAHASDMLALKIVCQPRETASLLLSSSFKDAKVFLQIEAHAGNAYKPLIPLRREWLSLSNEQRLITIPIPEGFRGGVSVHAVLVRDYRCYPYHFSISVPWTNKELRVEKQTFRDKTRPASKEEWTLTVRGEKAELLASEAVATLYDASLDAIGGESYVYALWKQAWKPFAWQSFSASRYLACATFGVSSSEARDFAWNEYIPGAGRSYPALQLETLHRALYNFGGGGNGNYPRRAMMRSKSAPAGYSLEAAETSLSDGQLDMQSLRSAAPPPPPSAAAPAGSMKKSDSLNEQDKDAEGGELHRQEPAQTGKPADLSGVQARTNLNETAFFMPQMQTNDKGEIVLKFTMPEALTRWRMLAFAHTPDMKSGALEAETITQKELMLLPNMPRFLREGDAITLPVKIANLTSKQIRGTAELKLFDALTMQELSLGFKQQNFTAEAAQSSVVAWSLTVPEGLQAVVYRIVAKASGENGDFSDGEEAALPVLANRMLVTETLPLNIRGNSTKIFEWKKLAEAQKSSTLRHQRLTLEMTSNPAWYAIQALPMMMEYPYECTEQLWNRMYSNAIATHLANSKPRIKAVFEAWRGTKESLLSNLEKNQELKALLLEETPWVMNANDETERKRRVGLLFDLNKMRGEFATAQKKLTERQLPDGGFTWFPGMQPSRFITQYLVSGIGHLKRLGVVGDVGNASNNAAFGELVQERVALEQIAQRGVDFIDREIAEEYRKLKERRGFSPKSDYLSSDAIQYLYARSFFAEKPIPSGTREAFDFWTKQAIEYWTQHSMMEQCMIALALQRFTPNSSAKNTAKARLNAASALILKSLRERALKSDEMGMYWKQDFSGSGWWWYQAPVETQALAIEAFGELAANEDDKARIDAALAEVEEMKIWLIKQKQTQDWKTTKATAEACYALLLRGADWLESSKIVEVKLGKTVIDQKAIAAQGASIEAGTGYYKVSFGKGEITPDMGNITVTKSDAGIAWGGVYWQYFEQLNKITPAKTPLQLDKKLYRQNTTAKGLELESITDKTSLRVGDLVKVRVELRSDREMEYIHLKDMRGAGLEPVTTLSGYRYQNGLGYYETMRDASANFFIGWLPRGVWVFEYALRVTHEGTFQNGITTIQSMYAPEFSSHSEGVVVRVQK